VEKIFAIRPEAADDNATLYVIKDIPSIVVYSAFSMAHQQST